MRPHLLDNPSLLRDLTKQIDRRELEQNIRTMDTFGSSPPMYQLAPIAPNTITAFFPTRFEWFYRPIVARYRKYTKVPIYLHGTCISSSGESHLLSLSLQLNRAHLDSRHFYWISHSNDGMYIPGTRWRVLDLVTSYNNKQGFVEKSVTHGFFSTTTLVHSNLHIRLINPKCSVFASIEPFIIASNPMVRFFAISTRVDELYRRMSLLEWRRWWIDQKNYNSWALQKFRASNRDFLGRVSLYTWHTIR